MYAVGAEDGQVLYALDAETGKQLWTFSLESEMRHASPATADGVVYILAGDSLFALEATTGGFLWRYDDVSSSPVIANGTLYVVGDDGALYAVGGGGAGSRS